MTDKETIESLKKELDKAVQMLISRPKVYIIVNDLNKVPFGEYYLKQRKHRKNVEDST